MVLRLARLACWLFWGGRARAFLAYPHSFRLLELGAEEQFLLSLGDMYLGYSLVFGIALGWFCRFIYGLYDICAPILLNVYGPTPGAEMRFCPF